MGITVFAAAACFRRSAASGSVVDNFNRANGALGTRSDSGSWTTINGTTPVISSNTLVAGAAGGMIVGNLGKQNGTYSVDINTTTGAFTPVMRLASDGSATSNYMGLAIDTALDASSFGVTLFVLIGGTFTAIKTSSNAVFTSGVTGTLSIVVTGSPTPVIDVKFNGTVIPGMNSGIITDTHKDTLFAVGGTYTGPEVAASGVTFDNFSAT